MAKVPKWDVEIERVVLGIMLESATKDKGSEELIYACDNFKPSDFIEPDNRKIFEAFIKMENNDEKIDLITLSGKLWEKVSGAYITKLCEISEIYRLENGSNWSKHFEVFEKRNLRIKLYNLSINIATVSKNPEVEPEKAIEIIDQTIHEIENPSEKNEVKHISEIAVEYYSEIDEFLNNPEKNTKGIDTGYYNLDKKICGFQPKTLVIIAGRPSMGKSAFVLNLAMKFSRRNLGVAFFSLEGPGKEIMGRMTSIFTKIEATRINTGAINKDRELAQIKDACAKISEFPLYVDETANLSVVELRRKMRRLKLLHPEIKVMIIDYLQIMGYEIFGNMNTSTAIGIITKNILAIAKELDIVAIVLSQLNRKCEDRSDKRPIMADLRESGSIEQDAHQILFLYRDEYYYREKSKWPGIVEVLIAKNRNGGAGQRAKMMFEPAFLTFSEKEDQA